MPFGALKPSFSLVGTFARRSSVAILLMPFGALKLADGSRIPEEILRKP